MILELLIREVILTSNTNKNCLVSTFKPSYGMRWNCLLNKIWKVEEKTLLCEYHKSTKGIQREQPKIATNQTMDSIEGLISNCFNCHFNYFFPFTASLTFSHALFSFSSSEASTAFSSAFLAISEITWATTTLKRLTHEKEKKFQVPKAMHLLLF